MFEAMRSRSPVRNTAVACALARSMFASGLRRAMIADPLRGSRRRPIGALGKPEAVRRRDRDPDVDVTQLDAGEPPGRDADNRVAIGAQVERLSDGVIATFELALPEAVTDDRELLRICLAGLVAPGRTGRGADARRARGRNSGVTWAPGIRVALVPRPSG